MIRSAVSSQTDHRIRIGGTLNSSPNQSFIIDFYGTPAVDASSYPAVYMGSTIISTNSRGEASFSFVTFAGTYPGQIISATATDSQGSTSEHSPPLAISLEQSRLVLPLVLR